MRVSQRDAFLHLDEWLQPSAWAGSLYFSYWLRGWETEACLEHESPGFFFFLSEMSSYVTMHGRRRPPARCDKPQDRSTH